ncbi:MAG TPA: hypothetical protein VFP85_10655 [Vicinamibacterales bacterium]|nr:hypothetical protein [Vicinamibacterales bacterium]
MRWRSGLVTAALLTTAESLALPAPTLEQLLDRMGEYLLEYETQLSSVVAEERFEQRVTRAATMKVLESEIAFMRLPAGLEWLGFRDVRRVNFHPVKQTGPSISEVLTSSGGDIRKALSIAQESGRHNLGLPRTINVPTAPLEIIHPRNRAAHAYALEGSDRVRGVEAMVVSFTETARPTLVREPNGTYLISSGRVWIEPKSGSVRRVEWSYQVEKRSPRAPQPPQVRVEFGPNAQLGFLVPLEMRERFHTERGSGEGQATYKNFRRFGTSVRIVPQP